MRVFISWSGDKSRKVAELLKTWIKGVIQATQPFISTTDLEKGSIWFSEIGDALADTNVGIICLTAQNRNNPWILFEAGALSKGLSKSRIWTFLIDLEFQDLEAPLSQFNGTKPNKQEMRKLVISINRSLEDKSLPDDVLQASFEQWWPHFEGAFAGILQEPEPEGSIQSSRPVPDMIAELLQLTRSVHTTIAAQDRRDRLARILAKTTPPKDASNIEMLRRLVEAGIVPKFGTSLAGIIAAKEKLDKINRSESPGTSKE